MISGKTQLIAHLGYPTEAFKAPMIYNPWFDKQGIDAVVVPMGVKPEDYAATLRQVFRFTNLRGALVTMPHKVATMALVDEVTPTARIAGACNAILLRGQPTPLVQSARARGLNAQAGFEMLIQQMPHYLRYFGYEQVARALSKDADFLREHIYPPAMHAEIRQPLRYRAP